MLKKTSLILSLMGMTTSFAMTPSPSSLPMAIKPTQIQVQEIYTKDQVPIWLVENQDIPVISLSLCFKDAGSKADPEGKKGISKFLARMLQEGCGQLEARAFKKYLLENNIQLFIDQTIDHFIIEIRCPQSALQPAFDILKMILAEPAFADTALERVQHQLFTELSQAVHSEKMVAFDVMRQRCFPSHPYGYSLKSQLQNLPSLKKEDLKKFMAEYFTRDQLVVTAAGCINPSQLKEYIESIASHLSLTRKSASIASVIPVLPGSIFVEEMDIPQSAVVFLQPGIERKDPDFYAAYLMMKILGDGVFDSKLWNEVREKQGLAYSINASLSWNSHTTYILGSTATQNKSVAKVIQIIRDQWQVMKEKGVTEAELAATKEKMIGAYPLSFSSTYQIIGMLRMLQLDGLPAHFVNERNHLIEKVTLEEVNQVAQKLLQPEKLTFIVVGKPEELKAGETK